MKKQNKVSEGIIRSKIQEILEDNTRPAIGRFHSKELNETAFVNDLFKNFEISPKK